MKQTKGKGYDRMVDALIQEGYKHDHNDNLQRNGTPYTLETWICDRKASAVILMDLGDWGFDLYAPVCKENNVDKTIEAMKKL